MAIPDRLCGRSGCVLLLFLLTAWALYVLLKPVNKNLALLFLLLNLGGVAVWCFSDLFLIASQLLLSGADYLKVFQADQLQALAMLSLYIYKNGFSGIAQIFFSAWLFPLGYLVFKSGFLPRILGIVLMVECFGWLMFPIQFFFFPGNLVSNLPEFCGWFYWGIFTYVVASDHGCKGSKTSMS